MYANLFGAGLAFAACLLFSSSKQAPSAIKGKELFERRCGGCHALDREKEGPRLRGVYGRRAGGVESFEYSEALKKSGIKWDDESLDRWLTDPEKVAPKNDMAFRIEKAEDRRAVITYLKEISK